MALPLIPLLTAIIPLIKQVATKPKTGQKEVTGLGIGAAAYLVYGDYMACGGLECVSAEHWGILVSAVVILLTRLNAKRKES